MPPDVRKRSALPVRLLIIRSSAPTNLGLAQNRNGDSPEGVKVVASDWIDYLHVAKSNGRWVIVSVLWEMKPEKK